MQVLVEVEQPVEEMAVRAHLLHFLQLMSKLEVVGVGLDLVLVGMPDSQDQQTLEAVVQQQISTHLQVL
jgi:hypothetical protein